MEDLREGVRAQNFRPLCRGRCVAGEGTWHAGRVRRACDAVRGEVCIYGEGAWPVNIDATHAAERQRGGEGRRR